MSSADYGLLLVYFYVDDNNVFSYEQKMHFTLKAFPVLSLHSEFDRVTSKCFHR